MENEKPSECEFVKTKAIENDITALNENSMTKEDESVHSLQLDETKKAKLNVLFEEIITNASIDYSIQEMKDIKVAVHTMPKRVVDRVNARGRFKIMSILPCGSMAEQTAMWKYVSKTRKIYTEYDFLAVLEYNPVILERHQGCPGLCARVSTLPVSEEALRKMPDEIVFLDLRNYSNRGKCDLLFWKELIASLGSGCACVSVAILGDFPFANSVLFKLTTANPCTKCVVEMATGILRVDDWETVGPDGESKCSLVLRWISKANTLMAYEYDRVLQGEPQKISSLSIHVDFLPALELSRTKTSDLACEHEVFLVPKICKVCYGTGQWREQWRMSHCVAEIAYFVNKMSKKHRKCYKIIKYCLSRFIDADDIDISWYSIKTAALNHSRDCSDISEGCAECEIKLLNELKRACETETLNSFYSSSVNIFDPPFTKHCEAILQKVIERLCSVTNVDTVDTLLRHIE